MPKARKQAHERIIGERPVQNVDKILSLYETDTRASIKRFTSIFEPLVILIMGIVVGSLILSMLLAITSINDVTI